MANLPSRPHTVITFYQGVPFDDTYKHVVRFTSQGQVDDFLKEFPSVKFEGSYQSLNRPIRVPTGDNNLSFNYSGKYAGGQEITQLTYNELLSFNYIRISERINHQDGYENSMNDNDEHQGHVSTRTFYAFPTAYEYQNDGTTLVNFSIDTWNTYSWRMKFTNGYVTRAHVDPYVYDTQKIHYGVDDYNKLDLYKPKGWSNKFLNVKNNVDEVGGDGAPVLIQNGSYRFIDTAHDGNPDGRPWYTDDYVQWLVMTVQPQDAQNEDGSNVGIYSQYKMLVAALDIHNNKLLDIYMFKAGDNDQASYEKVFESNGLSLVDYYKAIAADSTLLGTDSLVVDAEVLPYFGLPFSLEVDKDTSEIKGVYIHSPEGTDIQTATLKLNKSGDDKDDGDGGDTPAPDGDAHEQARWVAYTVGKDLGVDPSFIYAQMMFETGDLSSNLANNGSNNLSGIKFANQPGATLGSVATDDGGNYAYFDSIESYKNAYEGILNRMGVAGSTSVDDYCARLKSHGYFTADLGAYTTGVRRYLGDYSDPANTGDSGSDDGNGGGSSPTNQDGFLYFLDVNMNNFVGQLGVANPNTHNKEAVLRANVNKSQPTVLTLLRLLYTYMQRNNAPQSYLNPKLIGGAFTNFQFTDGRGNVRNLNPLQIVDNSEWDPDEDRWLPQVWRYGGLAPNSKLEYTFPQFNRARNMATFDSVGDAGDYYDRPINAENSAVIDQSAHDVPIVLDTYAMFINANRNQLAVTRTNAQLALQLAKEGNALQVTNAGIMANAGVASAQVNGAATAAQASNNAYASQATAYNSSRLQSGNAAATTLRNGSIMAGAQAANGAIAAGAMVQSAQIQAAANMEVARNNAAFQNKVATNNYEEVLRNQNAMLADTKNHNDVIAHQGSNLTWDIQNKNFPSWAIYTASPSVLNMANTYFNLFGISVGLYEDVNKYFNQFTHFNYMKVQDIGIVADTTERSTLPPNIAIDIVKSVFANGVTIWQPKDYAYDGSSWQDKFLNRDILNNVPVKAIDN